MHDQVSNDFNSYKNVSLHKEWRFPFRISSVNVTKSAENGGLLYSNRFSLEKFS